MASPDLVILEQDHARFVQILDRLRQESNAKLTFLIDKNGQQLARSGELDGVDPTSLASLTAGNVAATDGLAQLIGEREFSILFGTSELAVATVRAALVPALQAVTFCCFSAADRELYARLL